MKKFFLLVFMAILINSLTISVLAEDIAYVVKSINNPDDVFISVIEELNLSYEIIDDSDISSTNFSDYGMILIGNDGVRNVPVNDYPSLIVNPNYYSGWSKWKSSVGGNTASSVYNLNHEITEGVPNNVQVYSSCCHNNGISLNIYYLYGQDSRNNCNSVTVKGSSGTDLSRYVIATKEDPRRVYFGITETSYWTQDSKELFKNSIGWLLAEEDADGDEVNKDEDCNDDDSNIWQILQGYLDSDEDGYGVGDLLDVCSGTVLGVGHSDNNEDCNDRDNTINPSSENPLKNCQNNAPVINTYSPENLEFDVLENTNQEFSVNASDIDNFNEELSFSWFVNNESVGSENTYIFNKQEGDYEVKIIVSDGVFDVEKIWNVSVKSYSFSNAKVCENKNDNIDLAFIDLSENEEFQISQNIKFRMRFKNEFDETRDFDVLAYLYDLTNDEVVEREKDSFDISVNAFEYSDFEFVIPKDLDENNDYSVFVYVESGDNCNQDYKEIKINRKEDEIIIDRFDLTEGIYSCGDYLNSRVSVSNLGNKNQDVYIKISSSGLGINERSETFELERFGESDSENKDFILKISDNAAAGEHTIKAEAYFKGRMVAKEQSIVLGECKLKKVDSAPAGAVKLAGVLSEVSDVSKGISFWDLVLVSFGMFLIGVVVYGVVFGVRKFW